MNTQSLGLELAVDLARFLTGREHLHYGLWLDGMEVSVSNLLAAQDAYNERILSMFPQAEGLRVLDIGGGTGEFAKGLVQGGRQVEIVVPDEYLANRCRENAGPTVPVHGTTFEDFTCDRQFDVCLFAESLQYIDLRTALNKATELLTSNGVIIVGDCFRISDGVAASGERAIGGGHPLEAFRNEIARLSLSTLREEDVTAEVAQSIELERQFYEVVGGMASKIDSALRENYPLSHWFLSRFMSRKLVGKLKRRISNDERSVEEFCRHNCYLMVLLHRSAIA
ncbi:MAG: class I SAM-dependent methyltransferase [Rhodobacteraceae bacterium]|nr:class I SAM-dependent methyltransferase [Paracoccaceae bacterium]